jgi:hypothetical protein
MYERPRLYTYATLVDERGRFVDSLGRVVGIGDVLDIEDGRLESYKRRSLLNAIAEAGLKMIFLPPGVRLPKAPTQLRDRLYSLITESRIDPN